LKGAQARECAALPVCSATTTTTDPLKTKIAHLTSQQTGHNTKYLGNPNPYWMSCPRLQDAGTQVQLAFHTSPSYLNSENNHCYFLSKEENNFLGCEMLCENHLNGTLATITSENYKKLAATFRETKAGFFVGL